MTTTYCICFNYPKSEIFEFLDLTSTFLSRDIFLYYSQLLNNQATIDTRARAQRVGERRERGAMGMYTADTFNKYFTVAVLTAINLLNYMDRFTLAGK